MKKGWLLPFILIGIADSAYLTYERLTNILPPCSTQFSFINCDTVLRSEYSVFLGVPLAIWGLLYYLALFVLFFVSFNKNKLAERLFLLFTAGGLLFSGYLVYLQLFILRSICIYCMVSAINSLILFVLAQIIFLRERKHVSIEITAYLYKYLAKPLLFLFDPEFIHETIANVSEFATKSRLVRKWYRFVFVHKPKILTQNLHGIKFGSPLGLAAGFDYKAQLARVLPTLGFGFGTIGTITNRPYGGNPKPRLGRLPESQSLMVNKGFKNPGAEAVVEKLRNSKFEVPVGISIGRSNTKDPITQRESVQDIISAFKAFERSNVKHAFYELNISCPNLYGDITFYTPQKLRELLTAVNNLHFKKPVFVKMPIELSNQKLIPLLDVIVKYKFIKGVIFGNLQKDRSNPEFKPEEVKRFKVGNFSGKPTEKRSNELIKLAYKKYGKQLTIIGCGGIFSAEDAYKKIRLGASLCQLITGMIFEGPQLIARINLELEDLLERDNFKSLKEAIGVDNK